MPVFTGVTCVIYRPLPQPQYEQVIARIFVVECSNRDIASKIIKRYYDRARLLATDS